MENRNAELKEKELQNVNGGSVDPIVQILIEGTNSPVELLNQLAIIEKQNREDAKIKEHMNDLRNEVEAKKQMLEL